MNHNALIENFFLSREYDRNNLPALTGLLVDVGSDGLDLLVGEAASPSGHGTLAVLDLVGDGIDGVATVEELLNGGLLEGVVGDDGVLAASVASSAVTVEDLLAEGEVSTGESVTGNSHGGDGGDGNLGGLLTDGGLDGDGALGLRRR